MTERKSNKEKDEAKKPELAELTPLQKATLRQKELREAGLLATVTPVEKFISSPRIGRAVRMFCYECNGYSRPLAQTCTNKDCALWLFRKGRHNPAESEIAVWREKYTAHMKEVGEFGVTPENPDEEPCDDDEE